MKSEIVKHITDHNSLSDLYSSLFIGRDVFLRADGINIKVNFVKFTGGKIYLDIPVENYDSRRTAIYTRNMEEVAYSHIIPSGMEDNYYIFETEGSQVFFSPRKEQRKQAVSDHGKKTVISQIISNFVIKESLMQNQARVDWIRHEILSRLSSSYDYVNIFFLGDRNSDARMSWIMDDREAIFISDINSASDDDNAVTDMTSYMRDIYYHDDLLMNKKYISEITIPLFYKMMMPFGYIQVNNASPLNEENLFTMKKFGLAHSESISKDQTIFTPSVDTISISDLSMNGLGMIFKEKSLSKHFKEDALLIFTAYLPDNTSASILCRVMNISLNDKWYRVGCRIESIDSEGEINYKRFIAAL